MNAYLILIEPQAKSKGFVLIKRFTVNTGAQSFYAMIYSKISAQRMILYVYGTSKILNPKNQAKSRKSARIMNYIVQIKYQFRHARSLILKSRAKITKGANGTLISLLKLLKNQKWTFR